MTCDPPAYGKIGLVTDVLYSLLAISEVCDKNICDHPTELFVLSHYQKVNNN